MKLFLMIINLFFIIVSIYAHESYCFRVYLHDKGIPEKAVETVLSTGCKLVTQSKWMSTLVVECADSLMVEQIKQLPVVDSVRCVWYGSGRLNADICTDDRTLLEPQTEKLPDEYGYAQEQIEMLNGMALHRLGRRGQGMRVAVIDAGFLHVDRIKAFASLRLLGTHNIVFPGSNVFCADDHGTKVLSCLAANLPGQMIGTAPEASYLLIKSEDMRSEFPIEEDYWAAALEYADSVGVDVITSSLGYSVFDTPEVVYAHSDLDGRSAYVSRVSEIAVEKGLLLFCSAGNEANLTWEKITFPGDVSDVLTVGAITPEKERSNFSSTGFTADLRIKPDVVALGTGVTVIGSNGNVQYANGTSFATPIVAGFGICLWQSLHWLTNREIIALIQQTASQANRPDVEKGYGIPDIYKAYRKGLE
ncbi:MAG: S8 family serine peptidase [Tannerella sp.]|jgi:subtilisin family serine protease|nr:S8 family serine peptidase [Tannerella sp.]